MGTPHKDDLLDQGKNVVCTLRSAFIFPRGSTTTRRVPWDLKNVDFDVETAKGAIY